jgi:cyclomaltodextrinase
LHVPDKPFAYGIGPSQLRVIVRAPAGAINGGKVLFNDRYAWEGTDYAPLREQADLWLFAHDGAAEYWAADLQLHPPRLRYRFGLATSDGTRWFGADGLRDVPAPRGAFEFAYLAEGDRPDSPDWARGAVFYQIFPDRFARSEVHGPHRKGKVSAWGATPQSRMFMGGDLDGIVEHLDHIESLGVDGLYLTPIFTAPSNHKYDTADYFSVDPDFGGNEALRRLVSALHGRGTKLLLDGVFNHVGATWPPFVDVRARGKESPHAKWFYFDGDRYETWSTNVASLPKLRTSEAEVRELVCSVGRFWVQEYGTDGWRLDVANEVDHSLWRAFKAAVRGANPQAFLVGEVWDAALPWLRGDQFDSTMNYPLRTALLRYAGVNGVAEPLDEHLSGDAFLDGIDRVRAAYPEPIHDLLYNLLGSHDEVRPLTALRDDRRAFAFSAALLYALPGIVSVYYGDEVGISGGKDPLNRAGMVWDESKQDRRLLDLFRRLGRLRRENRELKVGSYRRIGADGDVAIFTRQLDDEVLKVAANAGLSEASVDAGSTRLVDSFSYDGVDARLAKGAVTLPPQSVAILRDSAEGEA